MLRAGSRSVWRRRRDGRVMRARTIRRFLSAAMVMGGLSALASPAAAAVPPTLTNQGRLFDQDGVPIDGAIKVLFAIYDAEDAKDPIWSEEHTVTFEEGYYSVSLGRWCPSARRCSTGRCASLASRSVTSRSLRRGRGCRACRTRCWRRT